MTFAGSLRRVAVGLLKLAAQGGARAEWAAAMLSEAEHVGDDLDAARWALGSAGAITMAKLKNAGLYPLLVLAGLVFILFFEWHTDEDLVTLAMLLTIAGVLGLARPNRFIVSGVLLGLSLSFAHALTLLFPGLRPGYEAAPLSAGVTASLAVLIVPSLIAAAIGARVARHLRPA